VSIDDSPLAPDTFVSADEDDDELFEDITREALSYLGRLQSTDMDPYFCYAKELPKEQLRREDELRLGGEIEQGMLEALVAATGSDAVVQKLHSDAQAILNREMLVRWMLNVPDVEGRAEDPVGEAGQEIYPGHVEDLMPESRHLSEELVARLAGIIQDCTIIPIDRVALSAKLFFADLSTEYLKSLWSLASEQDPGGPTGTRVLAALDKADKAKRRLVEVNLKLVIWSARKYGGLPLMDRIQDGNIGLMKAAEKFSHRRGVKFSTYAIWWIRQSIFRGISDTGRIIRLPVHVHERYRKIERIRNRIFAETGRETPSADEIAPLAEMPAGQVQKRLDIPEDPDLVDNFFEQVALLADTEHQSAEDRLTEVELQAVIQQMLKELDPRQADVLRRRFGIGCDEHTLEEIGQLYGVTRERIRQIETKALNGLKHPLRARQLIGFT
jgi:RNA polymerase primary sigma factor